MLNAPGEVKVPRALRIALPESVAREWVLAARLVVPLPLRLSAPVFVVIPCTP
jgi:hypothetical protein